MITRKALIPILLFLALLFLLSKSSLFKIKKVICKTEVGVCPQEISKKIEGLTLGRSILYLSESEIISKMKDKPFNLKDAKINKEFPDKIIFTVKGRIPVAAVKPANAEDYYLVDGDGILISGNVQGLPVITVENLTLPKEGDKFDNEAILSAVQAINGLKLNLYEPDRAVVTSEWTTEVYLKNNQKIIFSSKKEISEQLDSLQLIFSRAKIEGKRIGSLDLRFSKPVVIYLNN